MNSCVKNNIYHPIPAESFVYRKRRYPVDFSTPEESHVCISPESFVHLPTPEEGFVYRNRGSSQDFPTPEESHVYRKHRYLFDFRLRRSRMFIYFMDQCINLAGRIFSE